MVKDFIPKAKRKLVYGWFAFIGLALGSVQVGYSAADVGQPAWVVVATAVFGFISAGVGYTAYANTSKEDDLVDEDQPVE